jgi:dipeptidyl aminopeptidase/acylaminoacyl peptidase
MDDLQRRFRRLDRIGTPDLWTEAVGRAAELELAPRWRFSPSLAMIAVALLMAALAGTVAVGALLNQKLPSPETATYENGMIVAYAGCGGLAALDANTLEVRDLVAASPPCDRFFDSVAWPAWSQDGSRLAFIGPAEPDGPPSATVYDLPTGEMRVLGQCVDWCEGMDISPDGSMVAYVADPDADPRSLVVVGVDSGGTYHIDLPSPTGRGAPAFSPDGRRIALTLLGGQSGVYLVDVRAMKDGAAGALTLLHGLVQADDLAWSPNGEWLAFAQTGGLGVDAHNRSEGGAISQGATGLVIVRPDGSERRILATGTEAYGPSSPTWSSDSASVAYLAPVRDSTGLDRAALWTAAIDGGEPTRIYEPARFDGLGRPAWSPDGEWIAVGVTVPERAAGVVLVRPDGSDVRFAPGMPLEPAWQPIPAD